MPEAAITLADIKSADWSLMLDVPGSPGSGIGNVVTGSNDVNQCIAIILTTPKGTDVLRPTFGTDIWRYIDAPISQAAPAVVREVIQSLTQWEPRIKVLSVTATPILGATNQTGARMEVTVSWQLSLGNAPGVPRTTTVGIAAAGRFA